MGTHEILSYPVIGKATCKCGFAEVKRFSWGEVEARQFGEIGDIILVIGTSGIGDSEEHGRIWIELRAKIQGRDN